MVADVGDAIGVGHGAVRLHLVRHGRAAAGWDDDADPPLDEVGQRQALAVAGTQRTFVRCGFGRCVASAGGAATAPRATTAAAMLVRRPLTTRCQQAKGSEVPACTATHRCLKLRPRG